MFKNIKFLVFLRLTLPLVLNLSLRYSGTIAVTHLNARTASLKYKLVLTEVQTGGKTGFGLRP